MSQRVISLLILGVIIIGVSGLIYSKITGTSYDATPSPSAADQELIFKTPTPLPLVNNPTPEAKPSPTSEKPVIKKTYKSFPGVLAPNELLNKKAVMYTKKGKIEFQIYPEASKAASNFIFLSRDGFYDGLNFHRVVPGFVIQGGDPKGDGSGSPGYLFEDELVTRKYDQGIVAMANSGPNSNGSQFFIMLEDNPSLPPKYTIFGKVFNGMDIVKNIAQGDQMLKVSIENLSAQ